MEVVEVSLRREVVEKRKKIRALVKTQGNITFNVISQFHAELSGFFIDKTRQARQLYSSFTKSNINAKVLIDLYSHQRGTYHCFLFS